MECESPNSVFLKIILAICGHTFTEFIDEL